MSEHAQLAREILQGGYDLHTHTEPSHFGRALDDFQLMEEAAAAGMRGVMIKSHYEPTASRAALMNRRYGDCGVTAWGGVVLNWPVGGLNPYAVESALRAGAAMVWMPTRDSENCLRAGDMPGDFFTRPGIAVQDGNGALRPEVLQIMEIVKRYGAALATGHLSTEESVLLCRAGTAAGVRMVLTHPEWFRTKVPGETQAELADLGVVVEKNWLNIAEGACTAAEMARNIRMVGAQRVYLASDRGQGGEEHPVQGMLRFIEAMLGEGISREDLIAMVRTVPAGLVQRHAR